MNGSNAMWRSLVSLFVACGMTGLAAAQEAVSPLDERDGRQAEGPGGLDLLSPMPLVAGDDVAPEAVAAYQRGIELQTAGDSPAALREFNRAVVLDANFAEAHLARAQALAELGQTRSALKSLSTALAAAKNGDTRADVHVQRGDLYLFAGQFQKALDDFDRAAELRPASADVAHRRGKALRNLAMEELAAGLPEANAHLQEAHAAFDRAITLQPEFADALSDRASLQTDKGELEQAVVDLTQALSLKPDSRDMRYRLAVLHIQQATTELADAPSAAAKSDNLHSAVELLDAALASMPDSSGDDGQLEDHQIRLARAVALVELSALSDDAQTRREKLEAALHDCTEVTDAQPETPAAQFQRGVVLRLLQDYRAAVDAFSTALRLAPENTEAHIRRGIAWYHLEEFDLALNDFGAVGDVPGDARPWFWTGVIHARRGEHLDAIRAYTEAIDDNARYRLAYANRAVSLMHLGEWQRAIADYNAMIQLNPHDAQAYYRRGLAQQRLGRNAEARRSWQKASQLDN